MKTLKKILVMCMTLVVMVGVTVCVDSDKQDRLLQFINVDLSEAKELETEANDAYTKVKEDENSGDAEFKQVLQDTVIPNYEKMVKQASNVDFGEYTEFNEMKSLLIQYWTKKLEAFNKMVDAVETQDEDRISKANELIEDADSVYDKYEKERDRLMDEYEVEWKSE